jgi:MFS family permease
LAFEAFAVSTLVSNGQYAHLDTALFLTAYSIAVVGLFIDASASKSRPFLISVIIMVISTIVFFLGTTPVMIVVSRAIQGVSTTFSWVTGLAFLVAQVGEEELGAYVGWTTVGVAIGEIVGPLVGGPVYDYLGHWAAFGVVQALLLVDILLRVFAKEKKPGVNTEPPLEQDAEPGMERDSGTDRLLQDGQASSTDYNTMNGDERETDSHRSVVSNLARDWLGTVFTLIVIFMVRGALEVVS